MPTYPFREYQYHTTFAGNPTRKWFVARDLSRIGVCDLSGETIAPAIWTNVLGSGKGGPFFRALDGVRCGMMDQSGLVLENQEG